MNTFNNNPNKSYTTAKALHKPSGYSLLTWCSFDKSENKQTYYSKRGCMKTFCNNLMYDQEKYRLGTDDCLSALMDCSKKLRKNIDIYNDKLKSINSKILMVTHTSNFI